MWHFRRVKGVECDPKITEGVQNMLRRKLLRRGAHGCTFGQRHGLPPQTLGDRPSVGVRAMGSETTNLAQSLGSLPCVRLLRSVGWR